jgi:hypothetical protein
MVVLFAWSKRTKKSRALNPRQLWLSSPLRSQPKPFGNLIHSSISSSGPHSWIAPFAHAH